MECPESIEELEEIERLLPLCRKSLYEQAEARIETGAACSISEASRQLGEETGKNPESIRRRISEEQAVRGAHLSETTETDKYRPKKDTIATKWTGDQESYTPGKYILSARLVMGSIDIDPASNEFANKTVNAEIYYTKETNGLDKKWNGNVFLNPPYSQPEIKYFINKLIEELNNKNTKQAILLTNNNTDTTWFHNALKISKAVCFTKGRINFYKKDNTITSPTNGQAFFYFGDNIDKFYNEFKGYGAILINIER